MGFWKSLGSAQAARDEADGAWHPRPVVPRQQQQVSPCGQDCPSGTDIRGWIALVAQQRKLGLTQEQARARAWERLVEHNPLPAVLGRVCPHPCESRCNRGGKEGAVAVHSLERYLGDWAIARGLALPRQAPEPERVSVGVIGAGPAGLSFAYQMARRGHAVTLYERNERPGGMLRYGIPDYRLPRDVLDAEIDRILDLGVVLRVRTAVGRDLSVEALRSRHDALFLAIGATRPRRMGIDGEAGPGVWGATDFMHRVNCGEAPAVGGRVVVVGGGNTGIDAARAARRLGAAVTMLYRRTREEMPALDDEVEEALAEGVDLRFLAAPKAILRDGDRVTGIVVQPMAAGAPDASGRASPVPVDGADWTLDADSVIAAVSQQPDWRGLESLAPADGRLRCDHQGQAGDGLWSGGDLLGLGTVTRAIGEGRRAAEALCARLRGETPPERAPAHPITTAGLHLDYYAPRQRAEAGLRPVERWLAEPALEMHETLTEAQFLDEAARCLSCGSCFGCGHCAMYCGGSAYDPDPQAGPGRYFVYDEARCEGCGKCIEVCPCGYLTQRTAP